MERNGDEFIIWLGTQLEERGWSQSELARRSGVTAASISQIRSGKAGAGADACEGIARGLGLPPEYVLRRAGLLPYSDLGPRVSLLVDLIKRLPKEDWLRLLMIAEGLIDLEERVEG